MALSKERAKLCNRLRNARFRAREGLVLVEGIRCAGEFLQAGLPLEIRFALLSPRVTGTPVGEELRASLRSRRIPYEEIDDEEMKGVSATESAQGILLVVREPSFPWPPWEAGEASRLLLLDGVQDPGNVGTLIRAARAFGIDGVLVLPGTADPWNPKAVRSAAGASAHLPVVSVDWPRARDWLDRQGLPVLVAEAEGEDVRGLQGVDAWALVLGNEGSGVRREILEGAKRVLAIPMAKEVDSLNVAVAGGILLFALSPVHTPHGVP